jgi:hypothetical protein
LFQQLPQHEHLGTLVRRKTGHHFVLEKPLLAEPSESASGPHLHAMQLVLTVPRRRPINRYTPALELLG